MKKAFTMVELIVVMVVIAVIFGIAVPKVKGYKQQGDKRIAMEGLRAIQAAVESYYNHQVPKAYPATTTTIGATYLIGAVPRVIPATPPYDPNGSTTTTEFRFIKSSDGRFWVASSIGVDQTNQTTAIAASTGSVTTSGDDICVTNGLGCGIGVTISMSCSGCANTCCNGVCVVTTGASATDANNCGGCGTTSSTYICSKGKVCSSGACTTI